MGAFYIWGLRKGRDVPEMIFAPVIRLFSMKNPFRKKGKFTKVEDEIQLKGEDEMNRLLDKIGKSGYNSLSQTEKKWLEEYSSKRV